MFKAKLSEIFSPAAISARETILSDLGHDPFGDPLLWERVVATTLGGSITSKQCAWDVEVNIWGKDCRIEVKFSCAYSALFSEIRGLDCSRNVFKWAGLRRGRADAFVMIGLDVDDAVYALVIGDRSIVGAATSLTMTAPSSAKAEAKMNWAIVPFGEILPAVARTCHNDYDAPMRRAGTAKRAKADMAIRDMIGGE